MKKVLVSISYLLTIFLSILLSCSILYMGRDVHNIKEWVTFPETGEKFIYQGEEYNQHINDRYELNGDYYNIELTRYIKWVYTSGSGSKVMIIDETKKMYNDKSSLDSIAYDSTYYMIMNYDSNFLLISPDTCDSFNNWGYDRIIIDCPLTIGHEWAPFFMYNYLHENEIEEIEYNRSNVVVKVNGERYGIFNRYYEFDLTRGILIMDSSAESFYRLVDSEE